MSILINKIKANNVFLKGNNISQVFLKTQKVFPDEVRQKNYFWIQALTKTVISITNYNTRLNVEYSTDLNTWTKWNANKQLTSTGSKIYFRGDCDTWTDLTSSAYPYFTFNGSIGGNIMSLVYKDDFEDKFDLSVKNISFKGIFNTPNLKDITELKLPATTLSDSCYEKMFGGSSLTTIPNNLLPASNLSNSCYKQMFDSCSKLEKVPSDLLKSAKTVSSYGYNYMFANCTSLKEIPKLPATTVNTFGYSYMFYNCASLEEVNFDLPVANLYDSAYRCMFYKCYSLTKAPNILSTVAGKVTSNGIQTITTYAQWLCGSMFRDCTSLVNQPTVNFVGKIGEYSMAYMYAGCTSLVQVNLKATTLSSNCYNYMFDSCTSLTTIYSNQSVAPSTTYTFRWFNNNLSGSGTFYRHTTWSVSSRNYSTIPSGWKLASF